ncbi:hypothetical protein MYCTH_2296014 [Thermothelomyces thermophilus ATCC 42464]|uniref:Trimethylguanosine synthase n=1 Tax=Thermothelomyces thermophilus (strain ATCC 42464 / BCRC 31852 / DSM 1799) TaxID=573729 RepID=G2PZX5_THET4|nr:uncharacterized protein MYCTH_2296014 [Thermothelomyces thermophilus ATCC 42464]AEO53998.1 hypothetical protein MYCTH_2296014 [Thermothelomyces thermophilus ATCC 42464]
MALTPVRGTLPLTDECHHYDDVREVPWELKKYWHQRYSIFTYYDYNIRLTDDAWFGVTPEPVATQVAKDMRSHKRSNPPKDIIVDLFAGVGGNTIAFALSGKWDRVVGIEKDAATLACAQHNAAVYGVPEGAITWVHADCLDFLARLKSDAEAAAAEIRDDDDVVDDEENKETRSNKKNKKKKKAKKHRGLDPSLRLDLSKTVLFASPPWGGVSYRDQDVFDLGTMEPYNLATLHEACRPMEHALYLPRTSDLRQIAELVPDGSDVKVEVVQYCMEGASKAMVAYFPAE